MPGFYKFTFILLASIAARAQGTFTASIVTPATRFCTGVPVSFFASSSSAINGYTWTVLPAREVAIAPDMHSGVISVTFNLPLVYTLSLTVTDGTTTTSVTRNISVTRSPVASFNAQLTDAGYPGQLKLTNFSTNQIDTYWSFNDQVQNDTSFNTTRFYNQSGSYIVTLHAIGKNGCTDSSTYAFRIADSSSVVLPNIFTPNYDGVNDVYKPITTGISNLNVWIYNRDGVIITTWNRLNGSWDGHTTGGEECSSGEYFVLLDAQGFDGRSYKMKSTLTLLR